MFLVDTSVWIDHFRGNENPQSLFLAHAIAKNEDLCVSEIIFTEILQGIAVDKEFAEVKFYLDSLIFLPMPRQAYLLAANIYRKSKTRGYAIRNTIDCLIAACAVTHDVPLLQNDKDYSTIAKVSKLILIQP